MEKGPEAVQNPKYSIGVSLQDLGRGYNSKEVEVYEEEAQSSTVQVSGAFSADHEYPISTGPKEEGIDASSK